LADPIQSPGDQLPRRGDFRELEDDVLGVGPGAAPPREDQLRGALTCRCGRLFVLGDGAIVAVVNNVLLAGSFGGSDLRAAHA
jgi:hypothetical protein